MKKALVVALNLLVLAFMISFGYRYYLNSFNSELDVQCQYDYDIALNSMDLNCNVVDEDSILSIEFPLTMYLYDNNDLLITEQILIIGQNTISLNKLDYNSSYHIEVDGFNFNQDEYVSVNFSNYAFSTVKENINIPILLLNKLELTFHAI